jgi:hypothetical protein
VVFESGAKIVLDGDVEQEIDQKAKAHFAGTGTGVGGALKLSGSENEWKALFTAIVRVRQYCGNRMLSFNPDTAKFTVPCAILKEIYPDVSLKTKKSVVFVLSKESTHSTLFRDLMNKMELAGTGINLFELGPTTS